MLTIPATIQALYKLDGVRKNFRASFPGGELQDITNVDIVKESLSFTESVCSQEVFRFGLAEASRIEFETVGIGNLYGLIFNAFIEIDTSSLSASQISAIQADPGDGALVSVSESDTGYGFYRIALGQFEVTSCPRDHQAMTHRKVTAFGGAGYWLTRRDPVAQARLAARGSSGPLEFNARRYLLTKMAKVSDSILLNSNLARTQIATFSDFTTESGSRGATLKVLSGASVNLILSVIGSGYNIGTEDAIYGVTQADRWAVRDSVVSYIENYAEAQGITFDSGTLTQHEYVVQQVEAVCGPFIYYDPHVGYASEPSSARIGDTVPALYVYGRSNAAVYLSVPDTITLRRTGATSPLRTWTRSSMAASYNPVVYRWDKADSSITDPLEGVTLTFEPTSETGFGNSFVGAYDPAALVSGILELGSYFAVADRSLSDLGGMKLIRLSPESPAEVSPGNIEHLWWDEYAVAPIGAILYSFSNASGLPRDISRSIGTPGSIYDMRDNAALASMKGATVATINSLLDAAFAPHVGTAGFIPIELDMHAWPWLEAGDALQITAEDGTVVDSYMLARDLEGVQLLMDNVTATSGELIEET